MTSLTAIDTIVFDLGGVILPIDYKLAEAAFRRLSALYGDPARFETGYQEILDAKLFERQERGEVSNNEFYAEIRTAFQNQQLSIAQISKAWNELLLPVPGANIDTLRQLSTNYRLLMLSNTNAIHWRRITDLIEAAGLSDLHQLFDKLFLSFRMGSRKPEPEIYQQVEQEAGLSAGSFIYIEDNLDNLSAAENAGWKVFPYPPNTPLRKGLPAWLLDHCTTI